MNYDDALKRLKDISCRMPIALSEDIAEDMVRIYAEGAASSTGEHVWRPMSEAPKYATKNGKRDYTAAIIRIDILAKVWHANTDKFEYRRFTDCTWSEGDSLCNRKAAWGGVDTGWLPVAWMHVPAIPTEWPLPVKTNE